MSNTSTPPTSPSSAASSPAFLPGMAKQAAIRNSAAESATECTRKPAPPSFTEFGGKLAPATITTTATAPETPKIISTDPFQNADSQDILDTVDRLHDCQITKDLGLPRVIIVGDQSSGKSSLLQSMTGLPFPVGEGLCTRFPTQIVFRRERYSTKKEVRISIVEKEDTEYPVFARTVPELTEETFSDIVTEASGILGVALPDKTGMRRTPGTKNFSTETLKVEITGPNCSQYSLTDLPGIFHAGTAEQRNDETREVRKLISSYMSAPDTIIVCVVNGLSTAALQEIFELARQKDPNLERTIGVITRCDMIADPSDYIMKLARNEEIQLKHGWFVVRNRSFEELGPKEKGGISNEERHQEEVGLFSKPPWVNLPEKRRGVNALKTFLSNLLLKYSKEKLPEFAHLVRERLTHTECRLAQLGESRDNTAKQAQYVSAIAEKFQKIVSCALQGSYAGMTDEMKVRKLVAEANDKFAEDMRKEGHTVEFNEIERVQPAKITLAPETMGSTQTPSRGGSGSAPSTPSPNDGDVNSGVTSTPPTQQGQCEAGQKSQRSKIDIMIEEEIRNTRGTELPGTANTAVVPALFRLQAARWGELAAKHCIAVNNIVRASYHATLAMVCSDKAVRKRLIGILSKFEREAGEQGSRELENLTNGVMNKTLQTHDKRFPEQLEQARLIRFENALNRYLNESNQFNKIMYLDPKRLFEHLHGSHTANLVVDIHDTLKVYYDLELEKFIHAVNNRTVEDYVTNEDGPLTAFTPSWVVGKLSKEELAVIAAESDDLVKIRKEKNELLEKLREAEQILKAKGYIV